MTVGRALRLKAPPPPPHSFSLTMSDRWLDPPLSSVCPPTYTIHTAHIIHSTTLVSNPSIHINLTQPHQLPTIKTAPSSIATFSFLSLFFFFFLSLSNQEHFFSFFFLSSLFPFFFFYFFYASVLKTKFIVSNMFRFSSFFFDPWLAFSILVLLFPW
ncbi:uncharacterized protein BYT42DRAFT_159020 [Radiomyces spectabilis]|uniref:uncharacterized protein n=1 Tax=Radiomyces spectabilis TaxID=64574 RepID=UPI00221EAF7A|nr:uncharacterized protein BYT42DRAFT_159020 [Radiomyces spectabilis]KAI8365281.1 hypothetical protein BYT42DRAFT_159020 [Radiomyces spectabilis]